jgi:fatty-acyl-CoA synthase
MLGYWDDPKKTEGSITDRGWMITGDLGIIDEEGYLRISGRLKDLIIRGGENISPKEVEENLLKCDLVYDAQVVGVYDEILGEEVCVWVIPHGKSRGFTRDDMLAHCKGVIAHYKIPKFLKITDEYPLTVTGKVRKNIL